MKVLIFGAGVLGSLYAAKLHEAGTEVTLVARGRRYQDLQKHGVQLEHFTTGTSSTTHIALEQEMPEDEHYDLCIILVQYAQLKEAVTKAAGNSRIPSVLILTNYLKGLDEYCEVLGRERVLLGHVNAGGERRGNKVSYITSESMTLGELNGSRTQRLLDISRMFKTAGFPVTLCKNMDAWKRHHLALLTPMCNAMYLNGICNYTLAKNRKDIRRSVVGAREAMKALEALGFPIHPRKLILMKLLPLGVLVSLFSKVLAMKVMDIGGARHVRNAKEEMRLFSRELLELIELSGREAPVFTALHHEAEAL